MGGDDLAKAGCAITTLVVCLVWLLLVAGRVYVLTG